ncbi:MAG TPA: TonB-dependent receptor [Allosphingosinicella sp.]|jgi:outer membrane receptor protein involved in Fe transport|uniref:TonB-dependent receptor domain-containing protein n=1 Tax=Allosphingosinicella sp. TaxID=2823234 RepID=UPI002F2773B1
MTKFGLLGSSALRSAIVVGATFAVATPAHAQAAQPAQTPQSQQQCDPGNPDRDPATGNCVQPAEGTPGATAPGTNPATTPSDEEPTQEELDPNAPESETLVVTGSRIPRPQFEGTIPGAQVTAEQIEARGFTNALDVLNDIPLVGPGASPFGTNGGQPSSLGVSFVDLLDLGTARTLTLVNGRRFVSGNSGTLFVAGNVTGSQVDLNVIPTALISRADVLTVGGAVAYGSDAIAGVVNLILRDDFEGFSFNALSGISAQGDAFVYRIAGTAGTNFAGDRGNVTLSAETNFDQGVQANQRREYLLNPIAPTFFGNGGVRNQAFTPSLTVNAAAGTGAFLPQGSDLVPNNVAGSGFFGGSILTSNTGSIFIANGGSATQPFQGLGTNAVPANLTVANSRPAVNYGVQAGNVNLVPGTPVAAGPAGCNITNLTNFCNFAPSTLPGSRPVVPPTRAPTPAEAAAIAQRDAFSNAVISRFSPSLAGQGSGTQRDNLALQLLAANRPTPREFLAANPNTDVNLFVGTFATASPNGVGVQNFPTVANTDPATAALFPRVARALQFDANGNIVQILPATIDAATTPSTTGGAAGGTGFFNPAFNTVLRAEQRRHIVNLFAHYDVTDDIRIYTENLYARVESTALQNGLSGNAITGNTTENAALVLNINNPFLDEQDRTALRAVGIGTTATNGNFILSRTNQDLAPGRNPFSNNSDTYRTAIGAKADFNVLGRSQTFDASFTYGRSETVSRQRNIRDIEYALALDAVRDPATGNIVCRAQIDPAARGLPRGINAIEIVREPNAQGVQVERLSVRTVTPEQIAGCQPLNPFGFRQQSQASRDYVIGDIQFDNIGEQYFGQASLSGALFDLPAGPIRYAIAGDYRKDTIDFRPDRGAQFGETRFAAIAATSGFIQNYEIGVEARIPIFGEDFNIPLFRNLDFTPGIRFVRQSGDAPDVQLLNGTVLTQQAKGKWNEIYSLAGSWRPVRDITVRGNVTRSLRQPSIVELFLGGQPSFINAFTEPCSTGNIGLGTNPTVRRANCIAAVQAAGVLAAGQSAEDFLAGFVPSGSSVTGSFAGSPGLQPERGESYTVGATFAPSFLPGFQIAADYITVDLLDQIIPTNLTTALQTCFDSPNFPDTATEVGVNVCSFFSRQGASDARPFEIANGFTSGFINLGSLRVKAVNMNAQYNFNLDRFFGTDAGRLELFANAYHLINYLNAPTGDFSNAQESAGTLFRPEWELQLRARYEAPSGFFGQWTMNYQDSTRIFSGGAPIPGTPEQNEVQDILGFDAFALHDATVGFSFGEEKRFGFQFTVRNIFDKRFAAPFAQSIALATGTPDDIGRRFSVQANLRF